MYMLRSDLDGTYYVGSAEKVEERLRFHNSSRARWTKRDQPWVLVHAGEYPSRREALRRERYLKSLKGISRHLEAIRRGER